jgi:carbonic anhydrase
LNGVAESIALLKAGNQRFIAGASECGPQTARCVRLAEGQSPFAIVLGCSDSRVPIETIFDQPAGSIFVVRVAGNFVNDFSLASIEFSVAVLKSKLVLVLGHTHCGAVDAAVSYVRNGTTLPGHIQQLVAEIAPAAREIQSAPGDWLINAIEENVRMNVGALRARSEILTGALERGELEVMGGVYDLRSGCVTFF